MYFCRADQGTGCPFADFNKLPGYNETHAPLKRNVTIKDGGQCCRIFCSDLVSGITGKITCVDGGFNTTASGTTEA